MEIGEMEVREMREVGESQVIPNSPWLQPLWALHLCPLAVSTLLTWTPATGLIWHPDSDLTAPAHHSLCSQRLFQSTDLALSFPSRLPAHRQSGFSAWQTSPEVQSHGQLHTSSLQASAHPIPSWKYTSESYSIFWAQRHPHFLQEAFPAPCTWAPHLTAQQGCSPPMDGLCMTRSTNTTTLFSRISLTISSTYERKKEHRVSATTQRKHKIWETMYFIVEDRGAWWATYSPRVCKGSDTT